MVSRKIPELLAPAGSPQALKAAIAAGADSVYLSGKRFGARKFAANFDEKEIKEAIDYAHLRGVKIYVTVNTLVRDDELLEVAAYLIYLFEMGVDAVLVQDLGVVNLARQILPCLELHASTQMTVHSREGVAWAAQQGIKRVVLARESSLQEIEGMKGQGAGLEVFIHGALCYCYSGQCLISSSIGGRSGNRGMCAQPCRKPYMLMKGEMDDYGRPMRIQAVPLKEKFLLSTRDLSVYRHLDKIAGSPVDSLKIEGRMKSAEYVAIVTSIYRRSLDRIARGDWKPSLDDELELALAFNRDFTEGHLLGSREIMGREMSDNRGVLIGTVSSYDSRKEEAAIRLAGPLAPEQGDGLVFISPGQELGLVAFRPHLKEGLLRLRTTERVRPGARVYLTSSTSLSRKAEKIMASARQIPIDLRVTWEGERPVVEGLLEDPEKQSIEVRAGFEMERAKSQPLTKEQIEAQLRRTGGTPFTVRKAELNYPGGLFAPLGALNQLRREVLAQAEQAILQARRPGPESALEARKRLSQMDLAVKAPLQKKAPYLAVYVDSLDALQGALDGGCRQIYLEPWVKAAKKDRTHQIRELLQEARRLCPRDKSELIWKWPKITRESFLKLARPLLAEVEADGIMVEGVGAAQAVLAARPKVQLYGAVGLNVWNHLTVRQLSPPFQMLTLSPELSEKQLAEMISRVPLREAPSLELIAQGNLEVAVAEDILPGLNRSRDLFWGLQDFKRTFPVRLDDDLRTHIYNSTETCLVDFMPRIFSLGLKGVAIDARGRTEKYAREMAEIYLQAMEITEMVETSMQRDLEALKEEARARSLGGITTGHFLKGLKEELS